MITDVVLTVATVSFVWCLSFFSVLLLLLSEADYETKNIYCISILSVIVVVLFLYSGYILFGV